MEIALVPTETELDEESGRALKDGVHRSLSGYLLDRERERFKTDFLVDWVTRQGKAGDVNSIVREIGKLIFQARHRFPRHAPLDAAYMMLRDGDATG
jgi:hypothetical protein